MPVNFRNKTNLPSVGVLTFAPGNEVAREVFIPWQDFFLAACPVGIAGSVAGYSLGSGASMAGQGLRYTGAKNACPIGVVVPIPQDAALSGSGTVFVHWSDIVTTGAVPSTPASLYLVPNGSAVADTGASTLGAAASGATLAAGGTASEINSSSLLSFNAPTTRSGYLALRFVVDSNDAGNTSGSNFVLLGVSLRYRSDRMGT